MKKNKCEVFQGETIIFETFMTANHMFDLENLESSIIVSKQVQRLQLKFGTLVMGI